MEFSNKNSMQLINNGIKPSFLRLVILDYLDKHRIHPTVEDIFNDLAYSIPTLSKTSVYNTVSLFVKKGILLAINIDEKNVRYEINIAIPHAHFRCTKCNSIYDVPLINPSLSSLIEPDYLIDNQITELHVYFKGICHKCKKFYNN